MQLQEKSLKELTEHYNSLPNVKPVKLFKDKPTALKRIKNMEPKEEKTQNWIAFISQDEPTFRVNVRYDVIMKHSRPCDFNGKPMKALRKTVEKMLQEAGK